MKDWKKEAKMTQRRSQGESGAWQVLRWDEREN